MMRIFFWDYDMLTSSAGVLVAGDAVAVEADVGVAVVEAVRSLAVMTPA
jgi:hypothetical protein